jgi:acyl-CoA synthetase (AMP-forming)/AMP-acid ligase II
VSEANEREGVSETPALAGLLMDHPGAGSGPLIHTIDASVTLDEARAGARALAGRVRAAGVRPGQAVAVRLPDGPDAIVAMFGIWLAGAVFVPLNARAPRAEVDAALAATAPAAVVDDAGISTRPGGRTYGPGVAFVLWTSGTTGAPKPILHTHAAYLELIDRVLVPLRGDRTDRDHTDREPDRRPTPNLIPVALALNAGIYNVLFGLRAGAEIVVMDRFSPEAFATLVHRHRIRSTVLPPGAIAMLNDSEIADLGPLRYIRSITAPLSPLQARRCTERFGVAVLNGYGQAEIGEVIGWTAQDARNHPQKIGAAGRAHPGVDVRIADADDHGIGRLLVRPPAMAAGYASGADLDDRVDPEGFVDTGDLARVDADGFVWIEGRAGDLVNRGGNKVFPEQVEEVLRLLADVEDAAVVGAPDDRLGEVPVAFVVTATADAADPARLEAWCREHLVPYKVPVTFHRIDALPRNDAGKLLRRDLAARLVDSEGARR